MQKIFYMTVWYIFIICKLFVLIWHHLLPKNTRIGLYLAKKAENFLFFSPRVYKVRRIKKELKENSVAVRLFTKDMVKIHARFLKPEGENPTVIFFHGQSENISKWQETFMFFKDIGYGALFLSYRGHLKSAGRPSEQGIYSDAETAVEYLISQGTEEKNIILWGRSLGSAPAIHTALKYNVRALILESPIENIKKAASSVFSRYIKIFKFIFLKNFIKWLIESADYVQKFENDKKIQMVKCPVLIMHAKNDEKIFYEQSVALAEKNPNAKLILTDDGSHDHSEWCYPYAKQFLESLK